MNQTDKERSEFEKWATAIPGERYFIGRLSEDSKYYHSNETDHAWAGWQAARAQQPVMDEGEREAMYYIQDKSRGYLGNSPTWWALNDKGYTAYISGAKRFTLAEARQTVERSSDLAMYPCDEIDKRLHLVFDSQDFRKLGTDEPCGWWWGYARALPFMGKQDAELPTVGEGRIWDGVKWIPIAPTYLSEVVVRQYNQILALRVGKQDEVKKMTGERDWFQEAAKDAVREATRLSEANRVLQEEIGTLFEAIKHGDQEHQDWLREKINKHFNLGAQS